MFFVIFFSTSSGVIFNVFISTSQNIGFAPASTIAFTQPMKFTVGIRTSSPGLISSIFIAPYVAAVAQLNDREYLEFNLSPNCFSNLSVSFAAPTHLDSNTFFTAFTSSSPSEFENI